MNYTWSCGLSTHFALRNCLFGAVKLTKNAYPDKYYCSGYGVGFDSHLLLISNFDFGKNIIFGANSSSLTHANNRKKYTLVPNTRIRWYYNNSRS